MSSISQLFPNPSPSRFPGVPSVLPGITPESTETLRGLLQDDYLKHHVFMNDRNFHNHIAHHVLAAWALGADEEVIQAIYDQDRKSQKAAFESPEPITRGNYNEHLGDGSFYNAYLKYFSEVLQQTDVNAVLEEHVFSSDFNFGTKNKAGKNPEMLARFVGGLFHPMIQTGYGFEFNIPGVVAEGLAQAAVHGVGDTVIIPASLFSESLDARFHKLEINGGDKRETKPLHAFTVLARLMKDQKINNGGVLDLLEAYKLVMENCGETILKYTTEWARFDPADPKVVEVKLEELQWTNVLVYFMSGLKGGRKDFKADFFTMHLVTSSLFLPSLLAALSPPSKHLLIRTYFSVSLAWWIARGKPSVDVTSFFAGPVPVNGTVNESESKSGKSNPWFGTIQHAVPHPDEHLVKCQRSLAHYASLYGSRKKGEPDFSETELPGADKMDGTLFLRAALLTTERVKRGQKDGALWYWDQ
ncbi:hypothetical protein E1B28_009753 [Marasmius oreades]|uniref:Oxidoreductase AflY n=1 Tax=Marasmius oreades TaxID=181124 RepID=A0A9P7RWD9_9AGAR|nr:uncharacterized protein E1B28_009753 [Marasmius oreades]KAG7090652.1 hypothetical protein E1B28_009753 [Marasmius oreades]